MTQSSHAQPNHAQCNYFCPVDVAKGLCRLSGEMVMTDSPVCSDFSEKPRCAHCSHFSVQAASGHCAGRSRPYWVDANTNAALCDTFKHR
ncbi:4-hydroxyphenylacetate decarboxylase small subunit [Enterobacteriaceae bacterium H11S18]|uniref:4-hydroxyphenylacetate decarboxylase small subunit n=1 Tax=Dryocola clanedunensis TaxID=2925396 RepID=UPI0022F01774|nr:4-hydroxyphenylacetate decarboxylase small subunit [Dryocola clanedunensis]MCT4705950.1 4-hydroxyphenylacetate decarboxylase small subunit [Dryocola clanedunensis]MCT4710518.1 4-hydroxyphenylacetate decarboxylase small subunit [Dryocola clanedunensis]